MPLSCMLQLCTPVRSSIGIGGLVLGLLLGLSCSGPAPERSGPAADDEPKRLYHVQLEMTEDKATADQVLGKALSWWEDRASSLDPQPVNLTEDTTDSPVRVVWQPPLYRVRLGPFASRSEAEAVLDAAHPTFPDAFIAPERPASQP